MKTLTLVPAYGRDYKSKKEVIEAFNANTDFLIASFMHPYDGKPANKTDLVRECSAVNIRYKKLRNICVIEL